MLKLILGTDWVENRDAVLKKVACDVQERKANRIVLVPELISHDIERRLCVAAGDTASRYAEVLSFTRLIRRVADYTEHGVAPCLDQGGRLVAMASAARQLHSRLKSYASVETRPEFLTGLLTSVDEFKQCCISSADLMRASQESQGSFAQKLEELSLLLDAYDGICAQGKRDPADMMTWLLEELEDCEFAANHVFYIDGFPDFTRQHMEIIEHILRNCPEVTVSLTCDKPSSENPSFELAGQTAAHLIRFARENGIDYEISRQEPENVPTRPIRQRLFRGATDALPSATNILCAYRQDTEFNECVAAAQKISELVRMGCRYRDISIVCADPAAYKDSISFVFDRFSIPVYLSGTESILEKPPVKALLGAIDAALGGLEQKDVLNYLKSIYSPLDRATVDALENYAFMWKISGVQWAKEWTMHPSGLGAKWDEYATKRLNDLNRSREIALRPILNLRNAMKDAVNLRQQVMAVYQLFCDLSLCARLEALAQQMEEAGEARNAQTFRQLWDILLSALEQLYDTLGDTVWGVDTFTKLLNLLLSQYNVGTIPPVLDAVVVGPVNAMRCQQEKHLFVLGASEGNFPQYATSAGVLTEQERNALRKLGVSLQGGAMDSLQGEFSDIYGVFCGARESVTVSCSDQPSFVMRRLTDLAGGECSVDVTLGTAAGNRDDAGALLARYQNAQGAQMLDLKELYEQFLSSAGHTLGTVSADGVRKIYGEKLSLSASQVDKLAECRLAYFLRYGLHAKERKTAEMDPAEFGTYVHYVLEETGRKIMDLGGFKKVTLQQTIDIADDFSRRYAAERFGDIGSVRMDFLLQRNRQELFMVVEELWKELQTSEFVPFDFELSFGDDGKLEAINIPGAAIAAQLRGFVDRVDIWQRGKQTYFRVVDYKTGKKSFDYCNVLNGLGLQMLLYLFALEDNGEKLLGDNPVPAGVQYFPARAEVISADAMLSDEEAEKAREPEWKRRGLVLGDEAVLEAMRDDHNWSKFCVTVRKDGTISGDIATSEQLKLLKKYVFSLLKDMVDEIASGELDANPYTRGTSYNACKFCPYGEICHPEYVEGRRNYAAVSAKDFWETIEKEGDGSGC